MTLEMTLGEKYAPIATRIEQVATVLCVRYDGNIPRDDLAQEMWLALLNRSHDPVFTGQTVNAIVNKLAWEARSYARTQFKYMNRLPRNPRRLDKERDQQVSSDQWEFIVVALVDPYDDADDKLTAIDVIDKLMTALTDWPVTLRVARSMLEGRSKREAATHLGMDPSTVTYHIRKMRQMVEHDGHLVVPK